MVRRSTASVSGDAADVGYGALMSSRALALILVVAAMGALGAPSAARAGEGVTGFEPADGAVLNTPQPTFWISTSGFNPNDYLFVRVSTDWQAPGGELGPGSLPLGDLLTAKLPTPTSSTFSANEFVALPDGTYYWQWEYYDSGCVVVVVGTQFQRLDCGATSGTQCDLNGHCLGPVHSFTINTKPDFAMSAPATVSATQGASVPLDVSLTGSNGFNSAITVQVTGLPPGVTPTYQGATGVMHIQLALAPMTPPGDYPMTITGTGGGLTHTVSTTLHVAQMPPPTASAPPTIVGVARAGRILRATPGSWNGAGLTYAYQWSRCDPSGDNCSPIATNIGYTYVLTDADLGSTLRCTVTATDPGGTATAETDATRPVAKALPKPRRKPEHKPKHHSK